MLCGGSSLEGGIPVVLDGVVGPAGEHASNGGPPVAIHGVRSEDGVVLGGGERAVLDGGAELVAPPEPAGLPGPALDVAADEGPVPGAVALHEPGEDAVLLGTPGALHPVRLAGGGGRIPAGGRIGGGRVGGGRGTCRRRPPIRHIHFGENFFLLLLLGYIVVLRRARGKGERLVLIYAREKEREWKANGARGKRCFQETGSCKVGGEMVAENEMDLLR